MYLLFRHLAFLILTLSICIPPLSAVHEENETFKDSKKNPSAVQTQYNKKSKAELLGHVLSFLDAKDLIRTFRVAHDWKNIGWNIGKTKTLDISYHKLSQEHLQLLGKMPFQSLILQNCNIRKKEARILAGFSHLTYLSLWGNNIGNKGAQALGSGNLTALISLDVGCNEIGTKGIKALGSGNLTALTYLNVSGNSIDTTGVEALGSENLTALNSLRFCCNHLHWNPLYWDTIGSRSAGFFSILTKLTFLDVRDNNLGDKGAKILSSVQLPSLTFLDVGHNQLGDEGVIALSSGNLPALTSLNLWNNFIGPKGARALGHLPGLIFLSLNDNNIGDEGAFALSPLVNLTSLGLWGNNISDDGSISLLALPSLNRLFLNKNNIGGSTEEHLRNSRSWKMLTL